MKAKVDHIMAQEEADFREQVEAQELKRAYNYMDVLEGPHTKNYVQVITDTPSVNALQRHGRNAVNHCSINS